MIRAVLFDLDGTLVDTERESAEAMARWLAGRGVAVADEDRDYVIGHSWNEIYARLRERYGIDIPLPELIDGSAAERERVLAAGVRVLPGARALVERLGRRYPLAIVSGSSRRELEDSLGRAALLDRFPLRIAAEDYLAGKPHPEPYLRAARALGVDPAACVVFEDSEAGIRSAKRAGMTCVAVRAGNFSGQDQTGADVVIDSLVDADDALLDRLGLHA